MQSATSALEQVCTSSSSPLSENHVVETLNLNTCKQNQLACTEIKEEVTPTPVQEFYQDKSVLVTGASGFVGTALVHKLLKSCTGIHHIYVILRAKKGEDAFIRLTNILSNPIFQNVKEGSCSSKKIIPVNGDIELPGLGLSEHDANILSKEVSVVFHTAANVKFDLELGEILKTNTAGTENVEHFCRRIENLKALVHVSTAYSQFIQNEVEEKIYPPVYEPSKLLQLVSNQNDDDLQRIESQLFKDGWPNTYCISKNLAEHIVSKSKLPVSILRPAIVMNSVKEPCPGWSQTNHGPNALMTASVLGILRVLCGIRNTKCELVPVDMIVNAAIVIAWETACTRITSQYLKLQKVKQCTIPFATREWKFTDDNVWKLFNKLTPQDQKIFYFNIQEIQWNNFLQHYLAGVRLYNFKEDPLTLSIARKRYQRLQIIDILLKLCLCMLLIIPACILII